jgi:diacylglycerol kinase family enzyme
MSGSAVLINPSRVSHPAAVRHAIFRTVAEEGWPEPRWFQTTTASSGQEEALAAVESGAQVLFVCGGDGTVRAAAEALAGTQVALAVLPAGTGNVLALNLGLPLDIPSGVRVATRGGRRRIDVGEVDGRRFTVAAGIGLDAQMLADTSGPAKRRLGWPAYVAAVIRHLAEPRFPATIRIDGGAPFSRQVRSVLVTNVGRLPGGLTLLPGARPDDGALDLVIIDPRWPHEWAGILLSLTGRQPKGGRLETFRISRVEVTTEQAQSRELDGDALPSGRALDVSVWAAALTVCVPRPDETTGRS